MANYLVVVDMQKDFVDGALGTPEARAIVPSLTEKIERYPGTILVTKDTHHQDYLSTREGKFLPIAHCIKGTQGHELCDGLMKLDGIRNAMVFEKGSFGSLALAEYLRGENERDPIGVIELVGVCTDICVVSNALLLKAFLPETAIQVDSDCCAGVTAEKHLNALETMRSCQIVVV